MRDEILTRETECVSRVDIVAMLTKLGPRGYAVHEDPVQSTVGIDPDSDTDSDTDPGTEGNRKREDRQPLASGDG